MFLLPSKVKKNWLKHMQVTLIFLECAKRRTRRLRRKIYEEHKTNFEGLYLHDGLADLTEIWNGVCPIELQFSESSVFLVPI